MISKYWCHSVMDCQRKKIWWQKATPGITELWPVWARRAKSNVGFGKDDKEKKPTENSPPGSGLVYGDQDCIKNRSSENNSRQLKAAILTLDWRRLHTMEPEDLMIPSNIRENEAFMLCSPLFSVTFLSNSLWHPLASACLGFPAVI